MCRYKKLRHQTYDPDTIYLAMMGNSLNGYGAEVLFVHVCMFIDNT